MAGISGSGTLQTDLERHSAQKIAVQVKVAVVGGVQDQIWEVEVVIAGRRRLEVVGSYSFVPEVVYAGR